MDSIYGNPTFAGCHGSNCNVPRLMVDGLAPTATPSQASRRCLLSIATQTGPGACVEDASGGSPAACAAVDCLHPLTAPCSPGLSHAGDEEESSVTPSARSHGHRSTATTQVDGDEIIDGLGDNAGRYSRSNDALCAAAAASFARLFAKRPAAIGQDPLHALVRVPLRALVHGGFCARDTLIFALVIAKRLAHSGSFAISWANCRRVLLCVVMLAGKIHADEYYTFSTLAACVGMPVTPTTMSSLAQCEWKICVALDFCLQCSLEDYTVVARDALLPEEEESA